MLPACGDKMYEQATYESVETEEDVERWNQLIAAWSNIDWTTFQELDDYTSARETIACAGGACER